MIDDLVTLRRHLHRHPDLSGDEAVTARAIRDAIRPHTADETVTGLGGHGIAAIWRGASPGPTVLLRAELDALPIAETGAGAHASVRPGIAHLCGHDGHATILVGLARRLGARRPARGRAILLWQPAEETGAGAAAVLADPRWPALAPDWAFALHNMPGLPLGHVGVAPGPANCASEGLRLTLTGRTAHAGTPETGRSPAPALAALIPALAGLGPGGALVPGFRRVTVTHARLGVPAFGIAPGEAELWLTLRALEDAGLDGLRAAVLDAAGRVAAAHGLTLDHETAEAFAACTNDPDAAAILSRAAAALGMPHGPQGLPMAASEDFGRFGHGARAAMALLGAGEDHPAVHDPRYDFPDALIGPGIALLDRVARDLLGCAGP